MANKTERYLLSKKFKNAMSKVGSDSVPFNNSTPTKEVLDKIREANSKTTKSKKCQNQS